MKWQLSKLLFITGKFFFWLSLLMLVLGGIERSILPRLSTISEVDTFFSEGGQCYLGGDLGLNVSCDDEILKNTLLEISLSSPFIYIFYLIYTPFLALTVMQRLWSPYGPHELWEYTFWILISSVWLLGVITIGYYIWKSSVNIMRRLRGN